MSDDAATTLNGSSSNRVQWSEKACSSLMLWCVVNPLQLLYAPNILQIVTRN